VTAPELPDEDNEPCDYDGYVAYVCGRIPGVDGKTFVDGSVVEDSSEHES
jgi:hypothetical protein